MENKIDAFMIVKNEEELVGYTMDCFADCAQYIGTLSIVDNGSTDKTLDIISSYQDKLNIKIQHSTVKEHGVLRTMAIAPLTAPWIFYLDGDETWTSDMPWLMNSIDTIPSTVYTLLFPKYWTILDKKHYIKGSFDPFTCRAFRNTDGIHFPQRIHTEPTYSWGRGLDRAARLSVPTIFDHTSCKSKAALLEKGRRYQWAVGEPYIGHPETYVDLTEAAIRDNKILDLPDEVLRFVYSGPEYA